MLSVKRQELKYLISLEDRIKLISHLDKLLIPDAYGGPSGYSVKSLYFDSLDDQDYLGKHRKHAFKKRLRLRVYTPSDEVAKFELKRKWHKNQLKESLVLHREDALKLLKGHYDVLKDYEGKVSTMGYELLKTMNYKPVSMVSYNRRAYTHPQFQTRVTLDTNLRFTNQSFELFKDNKHLFSPVTSPDETILEVKFDTFLLPYLQDAFKGINLRDCPISKFASSRPLLREIYA